MQRLIWTGAALAGTAALAFAAHAATGPAPADAVYLHGKVFTANAHDAIVRAFAVKDGKFVAVGADAAVQRYVGPKTKVVDLKGRFVSPGLTDDHFHNEGGGDGRWWTGWTRFAFHWEEMPGYLVLPITPSTSQLMDSIVGSSRLSALPAGTTTLPVLSFSSPVKTSKLPAMKAALAASASFLASSLTAGP